MQKRTWTILGFVIGIEVGFVGGRMQLEHQYSKPYAVVSAADEKHAAVADADPTPKAGTRILKPMPITKAREALAQLTAKDPAISPIAAVGADDSGALELHVTVENKGTCTITGLSGVAYGFDANGRPAALNKAGEDYVAFAVDKLDKPLPPGKKTVAAEKLRYADNATLAIAHVDKIACADGTTWTRPQ